MICPTDVFECVRLDASEGRLAAPEPEPECEVPVPEPVAVAACVEDDDGERCRWRDDLRFWVFSGLSSSAVVDCE